MLAERADRRAAHPRIAEVVADAREHPGARARCVAVAVVGARELSERAGEREARRRAAVVFERVERGRRDLRRVHEPAGREPCGELAHRR